MPKIDMNLIKELRKRTDSGFSDCKKALTEAEGDLEKAIDIIHKAGLAKADRKSSRIAAEGQIFFSSDDDSSVMIELNSETDFAAKGDDFTKFGQAIADLCVSQKCFDVNTLNSLTFPGSDMNVDEARKSLIGVLGENVQIRRIGHALSENGVIAYYQHGIKIGVLVKADQNEDVAKDIAMHVAAMSPLKVSPNELDPSIVEREKAVFLEQTMAMGKPQEIAEKIVVGKLQKYLDEITLLGQNFVKEPKLKVRDYLKQNKVEVLEFVRFELGEGIEKEETDFASEVQSQISKS